jgi:hypothetical protein
MKNDPFFKFTVAVILAGVIAAFASPAARPVVQPVPASVAPVPATRATAPDTRPSPALVVDKPHRHDRGLQKS